jgi:hypothetical protein
MEADVRYGSEADIAARFGHVRYTPRADKLRGGRFVRIVPIVLQKSKVAGSRIFRENMNRGVVADSYSLNRVTEVACEFNVRR